MDKVLRVSEAAHRAAKIEAASRGVTLSEFVDKALMDYISKVCEQTPAPPGHGVSATQ